MATFSDKVRSTDSLRVATPAGVTGGTAVDAVIITPIANTANANILTIQNASFAQPTTLTIPDPGAAASYFQVSQSSSAASAPDAIVRVITAGQAALAAAGKVVVQAHTSATSQFVVLDIKVMASTGLTGNSGNRLLSLSDGTIVFNNAGITAAVLGTPVTTLWGGTGNPVSSAGGLVSTAGADLYLQYIGGTTDYNAGSVIIVVTLAQVTA